MIGAQDLAVHDVRNKWNNEKGHQRKVETAFLHRDKFRNATGSQHVSNYGKRGEYKPSKSSEFTDGSSSTGKRHANNRLAKSVRCANENDSDKDGHAARERDVATAEQILEIADKGGHDGNGQCVCDGQPRGLFRRSDVFHDVGEGATHKVKRNLGA